MTPDFRQHKEFHEYVRGQVLTHRIGFLSVITAIVLSFYLISFWYLQVVEADRYAAMAEQNRIRRVLVRAPRGAILDRHGEIFAKSRVSFSMFINREVVHDLEETFAALARILDTDEEEIRDRFAHASARLPRFEPVQVAEDVPLGAVAWVEAHKAEFPGLDIEVESLRHYEGGASGAHLLGYVGEISASELAAADHEGARRGDIVGKTGLERHLETQLRGSNGFRQVVVNNVGREVDSLGGGVPASAGRNVRASVDLQLQRTLDLAFGSNTGAAVFMHPRTGEILAMTSRPGFDPNLFAKRFKRALWRSLVADPRHPLQNRAVLSGYSPGSTFKLVEAIAGLEEGIITPETRFYCGGGARFHGRTFHCHQRGGHGSLDLHQAIVKSCNIYFYNVASLLGIERLAEYARSFGLGSRTGIPLGAESPGLVPDARWKMRATGERWYPSETVSVGIGQGPLLVSPLQQAVVAAALATDGRRPVPLLRPVSGPEEGEAPGAGGQLRGEPVAPAHLKVVRQAMWGVVHEGGTGWRARVPGYDVCGKTGTVQVVAASADVKDEEDLPPEQRDHSWFIGFAPLSHPEVAFAVIVEHGGHGSQAAAILVREALEAFFGHRPLRPQQAPSQEVAQRDSAGDARLF